MTQKDDRKYSIEWECEMNTLDAIVPIYKKDVVCIYVMSRVCLHKEEIL